MGGRNCSCCWSTSPNIFSILLGSLKRGINDLVSACFNIPRPFFSLELLFSDPYDIDCWLGEANRWTSSTWKYIWLVEQVAELHLSWTIPNKTLSKLLWNLVQVPLGVLVFYSFCMHFYQKQNSNSCAICTAYPIRLICILQYL